LLDDPNVLVGTATRDDAAVYRLNDEQALVVTTDFFTPIVDDPYDFGRIAAANALSDVWAMGARPLVALNLVAFPTSTVPMEVLGRILDGGRDTVQAAGAALLGGHSIQDEEPKYGLAVVGVVHPDAVLGNVGAQPGDVLLLTKPIGTGIITTGLKRGMTTPEEAAQATASMATLNRAAGEAFARHHAGVHALTDVTGYGLIGHLLEMLEGSGVSAEISLSQVPLLDGARRLADADVFPGGTRANLAAAADNLARVDTSERDALILCDAQTSGGLLAAVSPDQVDEVERALSSAGCGSVARVGAVHAGPPQVRVLG
jgi:selenide,water dikinase